MPAQPAQVKVRRAGAAPPACRRGFQPAAAGGRLRAAGGRPIPRLGTSAGHGCDARHATRPARPARCRHAPPPPAATRRCDFPAPAVAVSLPVVTRGRPVVATGVTGRCPSAQARLTCEPPAWWGPGHPAAVQPCCCAAGLHGRPCQPARPTSLPPCPAAAPPAVGEPCSSRASLPARQGRQPCSRAAVQPCKPAASAGLPALGALVQSGKHTVATRSAVTGCFGATPTCTAATTPTRPRSRPARTSEHRGTARGMGGGSPPVPFRGHTPCVGPTPGRWWKRRAHRRRAGVPARRRGARRSSIPARPAQLDPGASGAGSARRGRRRELLGALRRRIRPARPAQDPPGALRRSPTPARPAQEPSRRVTAQAEPGAAGAGSARRVSAQPDPGAAGASTLSARLGAGSARRGRRRIRPARLGASHSPARPAQEPTRRVTAQVKPPARPAQDPPGALRRKSQPGAPGAENSRRVTAQDPPGAPGAGRAGVPARPAQRI